MLSGAILSENNVIVSDRFRAGSDGADLCVESIADTLRRQASQLAAMADLIESADLQADRGVPMRAPSSAFEKPLSLAIDLGRAAQAFYQQRRARDEVFLDSDLFGEPAWDILLDLARAQAAGERTSVKSVCVGSCSPSTTALRWLGVLEKRGLVEREEDPFDRRRAYVRLSKEATAKLRRYFGALSQIA